MNSRSRNEAPAKGFLAGVNENKGNGPLGGSRGGHPFSNGNHQQPNAKHAPWQNFDDVFGFDENGNNGTGGQNEKRAEQQKSEHEEQVVRAGFGCSNEDIARLPQPRNRGKGRRSGLAKRSDSGCNQKQNSDKEKDDTKAAADGAMKPVFPADTHRNWLHCANCGRAGHAADECYRGPDGLIKNSPNKRNMRCYNCQGTGHMAARCPKPRINYSPRKQKPSNVPSAKETGGNATGDQLAASSSPAAGRTMDPEALEIMRLLMQNPTMRRHATRIAPDLYEETISYMLARVKL